MKKLIITGLFALTTFGASNLIAMVEQKKTADHVDLFLGNLTRNAQDLIQKIKNAKEQGQQQFIKGYLRDLQNLHKYVDTLIETAEEVYGEAPTIGLGFTIWKQERGDTLSWKQLPQGEVLWNQTKGFAVSPDVTYRQLPSSLYYWKSQGATPPLNVRGKRTAVKIAPDKKDFSFDAKVNAYVDKTGEKFKPQ